MDEAIIDVRLYLNTYHRYTATYIHGIDVSVLEWVMREILYSNTKSRFIYSISEFMDCSFEDSDDTINGINADVLTAFFESLYDGFIKYLAKFNIESWDVIELSASNNSALLGVIYGTR